MGLLQNESFAAVLFCVFLRIICGLCGGSVPDNDLFFVFWVWQS